MVNFKIIFFFVLCFLLVGCAHSPHPSGSLGEAYRLLDGRGDSKSEDGNFITLISWKNHTPYYPKEETLELNLHLKWDDWESTLFFEGRYRSKDPIDIYALIFQVGNKEVIVFTRNKRSYLTPEEHGLHSETIRFILNSETLGKIIAAPALELEIIGHTGSTYCIVPSTVVERWRDFKQNYVDKTVKIRRSTNIEITRQEAYALGGHSATEVSGKRVNLALVSDKIKKDRTTVDQLRSFYGNPVSIIDKPEGVVVWEYIYKEEDYTSVTPRKRSRALRFSLEDNIVRDYSFEFKGY